MHTKLTPTQMLLQILVYLNLTPLYNTHVADFWQKYFVQWTMDMYLS